MSNDDETVERVARALAAEASTTEMGAAGFNHIHRKEYVEICWRDHEDRARAALSAMPSRDELLREALDALAYVIENRSCNHRIAENQAAVDFYAKACATCRARAAADKIRAGVKEGDVDA